MVLVWARPRPRVSEIMAMRLGDLYQIRLTEWDDF
jgi:hypothetical protein